MGHRRPTPPIGAGPPGSCGQVVWLPRPTSGVALSRIYSYRKPKTGEPSQKYSAASAGGNYKERKSSPAGRNLPGKFLPREGSHHRNISPPLWGGNYRERESSPAGRNLLG